MDWQATELNNAWRYAFMALVRRSPAYGDAEQVAASAVGLSIDRWLMTPIKRPVLRAVEAYVARMQNRPAYLESGGNGIA